MIILETQLEIRTVKDFQLVFSMKQTDVTSVYPSDKGQPNLLILGYADGTVVSYVMSTWKDYTQVSYYYYTVCTLSSTFVLGWCTD